MIWFQCGQCGKRHGRPESAVGSVIFCECGHGNRVPWESTAPPEPTAEAAPAVLPAAHPSGGPAPPPLPARLEAVPVGEERLPIPPPARPARRARGRRRDPAFCFNHRDVPSETTCDACKEHFCRACLVQDEGKTLCGPCKNYRYRALGRPPRVSGMAVAAVIVALVAGGLMPFLVAPLAAGGSAPFLILGLALAPQLVAALLGALALHTTAANPKIGGQSLAITALVTAAVSSLLLGALTLLNSVQWV